MEHGSEDRLKGELDGWSGPQKDRKVWKSLYLEVKGG